MIQAFLFDYGGVISKGGARDSTRSKLGANSNLSDKLSRNLKITPEEAADVVGPLNWMPFMKGQINEEVFWKNVEERFNKVIPKELRNVWNTWDEMRPETEMVKLIEGLKINYKVGLLSNTIPPTAQAIRKNGGYDGFNFVILSCEAGVAKPDKEAYEFAMAKLPGIQPQEVVFIDDQERCLVPASELGMKTILALNPPQIKKDIDSLLSLS